MALPADLLLFVVGTAVAAFFIHLAAAFALGGTPVWRAVFIAALGNLLGFLLFLFFRDFSILGNTIMVVSWLAITATIYRTSIWKAVFIGLFAYLLWVLTRELVRSLASLVGL